MTDNGLSLVAEPRGNDKLRLTVRLNGNVLFCDSLNPASARARQRFIDAVHERCPAVGVEQLEGELLRLIPEPKPAESVNETQTPRDSPEAQARAEEYLHNPDLMTLVCDDIALLGVAGERALCATIYLVGTSRLLQKPLAAIVQGSSSSGKSFIVETAARLFPP